MIRAIDPTRRKKYTSVTEEHLPEDERTWVEIQYPTVRLMEKIENDSIEMITAGDKVTHKIKTGTQKVSLWLNCIKDFGNLQTDNGDDVKFNGASAKDIEESINYLPLWFRDEIANELRGNEDANDALRKRAEERASEVKVIE